MSWLDALVHGAGVAPAPDDVRPDAQVYAYESLSLAIGGVPVTARAVSYRAQREVRAGQLVTTEHVEPQVYRATFTVKLDVNLAGSYDDFVRQLFGAFGIGRNVWRAARRGLRKGLRRTERREARRYGTT